MDAFQWGFCTPGQIMSLRALLNETIRPSEEASYVFNHTTRFIGDEVAAVAIDEELGLPIERVILYLGDTANCKAAQNMHVLPARLPRSGMAFSSRHSGSYALLILI